MIRTKIVPFFLFALLAVYVFFAYHLLMTPLLLEFSLIGIAIGWGSLLLLFFILPKKFRKQIAVFVLLVIFTTKAFHQIGSTISFSVILSFLFVILVISLVARFYGKLTGPMLLSLLTVSLVINFTVPRDEIRLFNHFAKVWESPKLYTGDLVDYFPLFTRDMNGDGQYEIITFGHRDELYDLYLERKEQGLDPDRMPYDLNEERLYLYIYKWNGSEMERMDNDHFDLEQLRPFIPMDYIGFPYYVWDEDFTLVPQTQRQVLAEKMGQFGAIPFHIMDLNINTLSQYVQATGGIYDKKDSFKFDTDIEEISIENGKLVIKQEQGQITMPTRATKIIDLIRTEEGTGIVLLSDQLEIWTFIDNENLQLTHVLTENEISNVMSSEYLIADIQLDGTDEILISAPISRIIRPLSQGEWEILFTSRDESLRFEDFSTIGNSTEPTIISLSKSQVRNHPLRFLTGFTYTEEGLQQDWKSFTSLINVQSVDITGNGENELVATVWGSHKVFVFNKHHLPVYPVLITIFGLLFLSTLFWRVRYND